jgi:wyosine [tRNA(Phe)-imidazoG37] synthetase (radical SAM superfamily)
LEERLEAVLLNHEMLDVITFAGNGEPTLHPEFLSIVEDVASLRDRFVPGVKIALLTNSTMIWNDTVRQALKKIDLPILKLDSAIPQTLLAINNPGENFNTQAYYDNLKKMPAGMIIQTMFLRGSVRGLPVDNTTEAEISAWLDMLEILKPKEVQIYSLDRVPPANLITKVPRPDLDNIAARVTAMGIKTLVV